MGIFSAILNKLRGHSSASTAQAAGAQQTSASAQQQTQPSGQLQGQPPGQQGLQGTGQQPSAAGAQQQTQQPLQNVDVEAVLSELAAKKGGGGNYRQSIVDLLKLLDLDSSLSARKELAQELNVNAGAHGSAEQNIALHKAVMRALAENGGKVPASLRD